MKVLSSLLISITVFTLAGCATSEPEVASADGAKAPTVKCKRSEASLGSAFNRDCMTGGGEAKKVSGQDLSNSMQAPGTN